MVLVNVAQNADCCLERSSFISVSFRFESRSSTAVRACPDLSKNLAFQEGFGGKNELIEESDFC